MKPKYNSPQEALLGPLFESALVSPFVFPPDEWYKEKKGPPQEPSDLAWVCGNCVILIHMKAIKDQELEERAIRLREEIIEGNLGQLKRWMKAWRAGRPLKGRSKSIEFSVPFSPDFHVIALSVIKCRLAECRPHVEFAKKVGITYCATLTQSIIEKLVSRCGSTVDLVFFMKSLSITGAVSEDAAHFMLQNYLMEAFRVSGADRLWPGGKLDHRFWEVMNLFTVPRQASEPMDDVVVSHPARLGAHLASAAFNELEIADVLVAVTRFREVMDDVQADPSRIIALRVPLIHLDFYFSIYWGTTAKTDAFNRDLLDRSKKMCEERDRRFRLVVMLDLHSGVPMFVVDARDGGVGALDSFLADWDRPDSPYTAWLRENPQSP